MPSQVILHFVSLKKKKKKKEKIKKKEAILHFKLIQEGALIFLFIRIYGEIFAKSSEIIAISSDILAKSSESPSNMAAWPQLVHATKFELKFELIRLSEHLSCGS